ncbi:MAG: UDP-glucose/GDP-mannose dehydrogenase family protein [Candidatus Gracilibacteria bacterium]
MKITIFGTGYVGLVTGTCLAEVGHDVMCIDIDQTKIDNLKLGIIPIYEPGLEELVLRNYKNGRLKFSIDPKEGINFGKVIFSAVGTPPDKENNHKADLRFVKIVAETVGKNISEYKVFINKSTVPVGTGELCKNIIRGEINKRPHPGIPSPGQEKEAAIEFDIVSNPEFLREGTAIKDFMVPDRIVCGVENERSKEVMKELYKPFLRSYVNIIFTDIKSAEIIKYAANSFLATKLSFINEIANFAEKVGANISDISKGIGSDKRIGSKFLHAGIGYGGSCFPKDVQALIETGKEYGIDFQIIASTEKVNNKQKTKVVGKLKKYIPDLKGKTVSIWGLSFKPKTDDIRDAPSIDVINKLLELGVKEIKAFDPVSINNMKMLFGDNKQVIFTETNYDALKDSDGLIILTEWDEFRMPNFEKMKSLMNGNVVIDGRNIWDKKEMEKNNFIYESIGK